MSRLLSHHRQSLSKFERFGSTTFLILTIQVMMMAVSSVFRIDYVHGFSRAKGSIFLKRRMYPFFSNNLMKFPFRSSSSLSSLRSFSSSLSSSAETSSRDNFNSIYLSIPTMEIMEEVGALISILSEPSDVLFLDGDLGAGKTTFSRGFIKCKLGIKDEYDDAGNPRVQQSELRITSPTYLLSNTYVYKEYDNDDSGDSTDSRQHSNSGDDGPNQQMTRELSGKSARNFEPLGLARVFSDCISLIEWPSRLKAFPELLPKEEKLLQIDLRILDPVSDERVMSLVSSTESSWTKRLQYLVDEGMVDDLLLYDDDDDDDDDEEDEYETISDCSDQR